MAAGMQQRSVATAGVLVLLLGGLLLTGCPGARSVTSSPESVDGAPRNAPSVGAAPAGTSPTSTAPAGDEARSASRPSSANETSEAGSPANSPGSSAAAGAGALSAVPSETSPHGRAEAREPLFEGWSEPTLVLVFSGRQNGYLEPCGCTGLANQKGGLARRHTLIRQLQQRGWPLVAMDLGNQVRRFGKQAEIQFQITTEALKQIGYAAATFGPADLRLTIDELAATTAESDGSSFRFISANVAILDRQYTPRFRLVEVAGKRLAITGVLGDQYAKEIQSAEILIEPAASGLEKAWKEIEQAGGCDYAVLLAHAPRGESIALAQAVPHFDLVVTSGGGEIPPLEMEPIPGTNARLFWLGAKSMYVAVVGLFAEQSAPWRFQRVPLDARFEDSRAMLDLLATYQRQLERLGLEGLGLKPVSHPSGREFVGSAVCGDCHSRAYAVWKNTPHAHATESLVHPTERSEIPRHFDPECLSCHVTGWNPQRFMPYQSGYWSLESTPRMVGNGCENCHGPGSAHVAAEEGGEDEAVRDMLRRQMRLLLADAEKKCLECHDLDNSPDFHQPGAFEKYWQQIVHPGKD